MSNELEPLKLFKNKVSSKLRDIYPDAGKDKLSGITGQIIERVEQTRTGVQPKDSELWSARDVVLISYANNIYSDDAHPLATFDEFYQKRLADFISIVHFLPFFPSTSDDGFSVSDYYQVDEAYGDWDDIKTITSHTTVMADVVLNHCSVQSEWFKRFASGDPDFREFFAIIPEGFDTSNVIRPRSSSLDCPAVVDGQKVDLWCTFSHDQVDLNFKNPMVLVSFVDAILFYIRNGVRVFRLDAIAFLWKNSGATGVNEPEVHDIVRLFRLIVDELDCGAILLTETNLPIHENVSYFGNCNEAHWIYNFTLPPLVLYALLFGDSGPMRAWSMSLPPAQPQTAYLNFLSSHDGIGLRPVEGILDEQKLGMMLERLRENGSLFSWRDISHGQRKVYEANTTFIDALGQTDTDPSGQFVMERYLAAHCIMFAFEGVPAIYFNSLFATANFYEGVKETRHNRTINRLKWKQDDLEGILDASDTLAAQAYAEIKRVTGIRMGQDAFHPNATQYTLQLGDEIFGLWRQSADRSQSIFAITNVTASSKYLNLNSINLIFSENWLDLLSGVMLTSATKGLQLAPYQTMWITNKY